MEASLKSLSDVVAVKPNDIELSGNGLQSNKKDVLFQLRTYKESIYIDKGVGDATCSVKFIEGKATLELSFPLETPLQNVSVQDTRKISTLVQDGIEGFFDNLDTAVCFAGLPSTEPLSQIRKKTTVIKLSNPRKVGIPLDPPAPPPPKKTDTPTVVTINGKQFRVLYDGTGYWQTSDKIVQSNITGKIVEYSSNKTTKPFTGFGFILPLAYTDPTKHQLTAVDARHNFMLKSIYFDCTHGPLTRIDIKSFTDNKIDNLAAGLIISFDVVLGFRRKDHQSQLDLRLNAVNMKFLKDIPLGFIGKHDATCILHFPEKAYGCEIAVPSGSVPKLTPIHLKRVPTTPETEVPKHSDEPDSNEVQQCLSTRTVPSKVEASDDTAQTQSGIPYHYADRIPEGVVKRQENNNIELSEIQQQNTPLEVAVVDTGSSTSQEQGDLVHDICQLGIKEEEEEDIIINQTEGTKEEDEGELEEMGEEGDIKLVTNGEV